MILCMIKITKIKRFIDKHSKILVLKFKNNSNYKKAQLLCKVMDKEHFWLTEKIFNITIILKLCKRNKENKIRKLVS
jgi:hypothetical protein